MFGGLFEICPLLNMDNGGHLIPRSKIRTKKKVIKEIVARMEEHAQDGLDYSGKCYISNSACYDDARAVADLVEARFPKLNGKVEIKPRRHHHRRAHRSRHGRAVLLGRRENRIIKSD